MKNPFPKKYTLVILSLLFLFSFAKVSASKHILLEAIKDEPPKSIAYKLLAPIGDIKCVDPSGQNKDCIKGTLQDYFNTIVRLAIALAGVLAIIMIIIKGIQYMGDESIFGHTEAKDGIMKAVLGLIIALGSYALLNTIDSSLLGGDGLNVQSLEIDIEEETEPLVEYIQPGIGTKVTGCTSGTADVKIPWGTPATISTCKDISVKLAQMLTDANKAGHKISGASFRSIEKQIALRKKNNCPDIYNSPSSACRPPTARPGHSMHERGLAIDFNCNGGKMEGSGCFTWLKQNASKYGFYNLRSEPWHWSTTGK